MKPRLISVALYVVVLVAVGGAYVAGRYIGRQEAGDAAAEAIQNFDATRAAEAFVLANRVHEALRNSNSDQAGAVLTRFAAIKVPTLRECLKSQSCVGWVGPHMPTEAQLNAAIAADALLPRK